MQTAESPVDESPITETVATEAAPDKNTAPETHTELSLAAVTGPAASGTEGSSPTPAAKEIAADAKPESSSPILPPVSTPGATPATPATPVDLAVEMTPHVQVEVAAGLVSDHTRADPTNWAFEEKLASHKEWVESQGRAGQMGDMSRAELEGAELVGVNLRFADFHDANLKSADLLLADLRDACMMRANLEEACLVGANLEGANLESADLETAMGLVSRQLAGANLRAASLPQQIQEFPALREYARASRTGIWFFGATMILNFISWLMIWKTKDVQLIADSSVLPFLRSPSASAALPTRELYLIAPALLFGIYLVFQYHLQRLWDAVLELPAVFPDGRILGDKGPWIITGLLRAHFRWMNQDAPSTRLIEKTVSILLAYWLVPATLLVFWGRYLTVQEMHGTALQAFFVVAAVAVAAYSTTKSAAPNKAGRSTENPRTRNFATGKSSAPASWRLLLASCFRSSRSARLPAFRMTRAARRSSLPRISGDGRRRHSGRSATILTPILPRRQFLASLRTGTEVTTSLPLSRART